MVETETESGCTINLSLVENVYSSKVLKSLASELRNMSLVCYGKEK